MSLLQSGIIGILAFIFILGAAVILHEFGHFIVAKLFKIRVETFSVGFGPRLFGGKYGTTDYRVSAIPLGGYVKLGGDETNAPIEGEGAPDIPSHERFDLRPRWQRILVAVACPVMSVLTALAIPFAAGVVSGSAAADSGLQGGDRVLAVVGKPIKSSEQVVQYVRSHKNEPIVFDLDRAGRQIQVTANVRPGEEKLGFYLGQRLPMGRGG